MICPHCHNTIDKDSSFCKYCGKEIGIDTSKENSPSITPGRGWKSGLVAFILIVIIFLLFYFGMKSALQ